MNYVRSVPLALQFPFSEGFKPQIVEEDLIFFFEFLFSIFCHTVVDIFYL
jgi:hypothetical protein